MRVKKCLLLFKQHELPLYSDYTVIFALQKHYSKEYEETVYEAPYTVLDTLTKVIHIKPLYMHLDI